MKRAVFLAAALLSAPATATTIQYANFDSTVGLQLNGNAAAANDGSRNVLRLTPALSGQAGGAFSATPIALSGDYSFSTRFTFNINQYGGLAGGADGLVFVIQTNPTILGGTGGGIGYEGTPNSIGIEFDTFNNGGGYNDANDNHIGVDLGGSITSVYTLNTLPYTLKSGTDLTAWVDYDGANDLLEVRFSDSGNRPIAALFSYTVDLNAVLSAPNAFVGFSSGTGSGWANHDIVNWEFRDTYAPITGGVPEPATWAMLIAGFGLVGGALRGRRRTTALA